jgi:hypothetical protein
MLANGNGHLSVTEISGFSLYSELADVRAEGFVATNLIKYLIEVISHDVCSFKRNTQTAYQIIYRATQIYKYINRLIESVDEEVEGAWDNYNKYISKIQHLEAYALHPSFGPLPILTPVHFSLLFRMAAFTKRETNLWLPSETPGTIDDLLNYITVWIDSRAEIRDIAHQLFVRSTIL